MSQLFKKSIQYTIAIACFATTMTVFAGYVETMGTATAASSCISSTQDALAQKYLKCLDGENKTVSVCKNNNSSAYTPAIQPTSSQISKEKSSIWSDKSLSENQKISKMQDWYRSENKKLNAKEYTKLDNEIALGGECMKQTQKSCTQKVPGGQAAYNKMQSCDIQSNDPVEESTGLVATKLNNTIVSDLSNKSTKDPAVEIGSQIPLDTTTLPKVN